MEPKKSEIVTPTPYFNIEFNCSNRAFYEVKLELYDIANSINIEIQDGHITEKCDYEGDLEEIIIYTKELKLATLKHYGIDHSNIQSGVNVHLSI